MKKICTSLVLLIACCLQSNALPFVPTTDPSAPDTYWYRLKTEGIYVLGNGNVATYASASSGTDAEKWCFVGDATSGYKVYNKQYGLYLGLAGYMFSGSNTSELVFYKERSGNTFYLWNYDYDNGYDLYLYFDTEFNEFDTFATWGSQTEGCFEAEFASQGGGDNPDPTWTRYDSDGVGYKFLEGGTSSNAQEKAENLCDNNANTKFYGTWNNCWVTMEASTPVAVKRYSVVTGNDSRQYYDRVLRSFKLQGSNDKNTWFDIDVRIDYPMPFADKTEVVLNVNDTRPFRYFKFSCVAGLNGSNSNSATVQLSEVWINGQNHTWEYSSSHNNECAALVQNTSECSDCHALKTELTEPEFEHQFVDGVCTICGTKENEIRLHYDSQLLCNSTLKALHGFRGNDGIWPQAPEGWNTLEFDDNQWIDLTLPTASYKHTSGPFAGLRYNSYWYGEYNCYWIRNIFNLEEANANDVYKLRCIHDDNMWVYVNGEEALVADGWTETPSNCNWDNSAETFTLPTSAFRTGNNVIAIYIQQNWGGSYFDYALSVFKGGNLLHGDVNGDGKVNVSDVTSLINMILGILATDLEKADVNGDGKVNVSDVTALINILLGVS